MRLKIIKGRNSTIRKNSIFIEMYQLLILCVCVCVCVSMSVCMCVCVSVLFLFHFCLVYWRQYMFLDRSEIFLLHCFTYQKFIYKERLNMP